MIVQRTPLLLASQELLDNRFALLEGLLGELTSTIYVKDLSGRYLLINRRFQGKLAVPYEDAIGKTDHVLFPEAHAQAFIKDDQSVVNNRTTLRLEEWVPHEDGDHRYATVKFPLFNNAGDLYGVAGIATEMAAPKHPAAPSLDDLSPRESAVLKAIVQGHTAQQIAAQLGVGVKSVESYRQRIGKKLGTRKRAELVAYAIRQGLLTRP